MTTSEQNWTIQREGWTWYAISPDGTITIHNTKNDARYYVAQRTDDAAVETSLGSDVKVAL